MPQIEHAINILILWAVIGYLFGSVPFGLLLIKILKLGDLRKIGSGNIGATNVLRTGNKKAAAATLLLDAGKGIMAVLLARFFTGEDAAQTTAFFAFLGHCFPVWLGFRGGKGVATFLGLLWALAWPLGLACCASWLIFAKLFRISSLSALITAILSPFLAITLGHPQLWLLCAILAVLILWRHKENIKRLRDGTETKINSGPG